MLNCIAIRKETKDKTQSRAPLAPRQVRSLVKKHGIRVLVEPWNARVFADKEYRDAGAHLTADLTPANMVFGINEIAPPQLTAGQSFCFFSHTAKGQPYTMPMLRAILDRGITLLDYELAADERGRRLVFFGDDAGYAGMIDSLWALGQRLHSEGTANPLEKIKCASNYNHLSEVHEALKHVGEKIRRDGLDPGLVPFICGFTGYGHVSKSAQSLYDRLPVETLDAESLPAFMAAGNFSPHTLYKVAFNKTHLYRKQDGTPLDPDELRSNPERYTNRLEEFVPYLSMMINGVYWEPVFPRLLTKASMKKWYGESVPPRLKVIGDITAGVEGSIEVTVKSTDAANPVFVYDPVTDAVTDGWKGRGPVIMAVDRLAAELSWDASDSFGELLVAHVPALAAADFSRPLDTLAIPDAWRRAVIALQGQLTPAFAHLQDLVKEAG